MKGGVVMDYSKYFDCVMDINIPSREMVTAARLEQSSEWLGDAYVMMLFKHRDSRLLPYLIKKGYFPADGGKHKLDSIELSNMRHYHESLRRFLESEQSDALWRVHDRHDQWTAKRANRAALFIKCEKGLVGVSWYEPHGNAEDALKMCAFMLYATGCINEHDQAMNQAALSLLEKRDLIEDPIRAKLLVDGSIKLKQINQLFADGFETVSTE